VEPSISAGGGNGPRMLTCAKTAPPRRSGTGRSGLSLALTESASGSASGTGTSRMVRGAVSTRVSEGIQPRSYVGRDRGRPSGRGRPSNESGSRDLTYEIEPKPRAAVDKVRGRTLDD